MKRTLNIFLILISTLCYSQNSSESDVFKKIVDYEIGKGILGIYVQCEKPKTFFDQNDFKEKTGLKVPENILIEIEKNGIKSSNGMWNSKFTNGLNYSSGFIKIKNCLTKKDVEEIFNKTNTRQNILSISDPIFDDNYENCVVSVTYSNFPGSSSGHKYFLKKIYGVWVVIVEYELWLT